MAIKYLNEADFTNKRVIARFDFNVPLNKDGSLSITDTTRIDRALPTIRYILEKGASKLILMSHLGRPKGKVVKEFSLEPVATYLAKQLNSEVILTESATDSSIKTLLNLSTTKILLLQNLRYHEEETKNSNDFAKKLASYGDIYVNDAFGTAHRKHASTYEINKFFKNRSYAGLLLKKEIEALSKITDNPSSPFVAIVGGAKVSDKIKIIEKLLVSVDKMIIGGAMAYPFLKAKGHSVGTSLCSNEDVSLAKKILSDSKGQKIELPIDHLVANNPKDEAEIISEVDIPENKMGLDIGAETILKYEKSLKNAKTILWNGPMGFFEKDCFNKGTFSIAEILSKLEAYTLIGGGDSVSAVMKSGLSEKMSHISTGGGASLEFIENGTLPGIQALRFGLE